jgi:hypothetical protein
MAMLSMQSQGSLSPSMGGIAMNNAGAQSSVVKNYNQNNGNYHGDSLGKVSYHVFIESLLSM